MGSDLRAGIPPRVRILVDQETGVRCSRGTIKKTKHVPPGEGNSSGISKHKFRQN